MGRYSSCYQEWEERLERWRASGLSGAEFCRREGIRPWQFYGWKRRIACRVAGSADGGAFVPLSFSRTDPGCGIAVVIGSVRLELAAGFDSTELARAVQALGQARC